MGLTHTGRAVQEKGVVGHTRVIGNRKSRIVRKAVGRANHEIIECELRVKFQHTALFLLFLPFLIIQHHQFGIGIEDLLQGILNVIGTAAADKIPTEIRGRINDQLFFVQLHHFRIVKPAGNGDRTEPLFQVTQNFSPNIIR